MPLLAERFTVVAMDLPGHGFTRGRVRGGPSLPAIAGAVGALLDAMDVRPSVIAGHSAGAAIALRMVHDSGERTPRRRPQPRADAFPRPCREAVSGAGQGIVRQPLRPAHLLAPGERAGRDRALPPPRDRLADRCRRGALLPRAARQFGALRGGVGDDGQLGSRGTCPAAPGDRCAGDPAPRGAR
ncbi:alpha/beta fold hydrolase [Novosphingobium sp. Gsoil 351]|uniref:alpha/beta fold hydrolase n=1 Tax=Novosphingobium sp. Gsoil 351 TaxID=2675225 RepID=UPI00351B0992